MSPDPWELPVAGVDDVASATWLAKLVALEDEQHDDQCCEDER